MHWHRGLYIIRTGNSGLAEACDGLKGGPEASGQRLWTYGLHRKMYRRATN